MDDLDLSDLTDDQLVGLLRAVAEEARRRNDAVAAAVNDAYLDETEKSKIAAEAAEREAAKLRAAERERVAREAAEEVRRNTEAQATAESKLRREQQEHAAAEQLRAKQERRMDLIREAATLCGTDPRETYVTVWAGYSGRLRVYIQTGGTHDDGDTLVTYYAGDGDRRPAGSISTAKDLTSRKPELAEYCGLRASRSPRGMRLDPTDYIWEAPCTP